MDARELNKQAHKNNDARIARIVDHEINRLKRLIKEDIEEAVKHGNFCCNFRIRAELFPQNIFSRKPIPELQKIIKELKYNHFKVSWRFSHVYDNIVNFTIRWSDRAIR